VRVPGRKVQVLPSVMQEVQVMRGKRTQSRVGTAFLASSSATVISA
jgi:hypothetical protein